MVCPRHNRFPPRVSWRCAACAHEDTSSSATERSSVADEATRRPKTTICCKDDHHRCNVKSEAVAACRDTPILQRSILGRVKDPLTCVLPHRSQGRRLISTRRLIDAFKGSEDLLATKTGPLVLEAISSCIKSSLEQDSNRSGDLIIGSPCNL